MLKFQLYKLMKFEKYKKFTLFIYTKALEATMNRKKCVIILDDSVIGDVTEFFTKTYMHGIKLYSSTLRIYLQ